MNKEQKESISQSLISVIDAALKFGGIQIQSKCLEIQQFVTVQLMKGDRENAESITPETGEAGKQKRAKGKT